MPARHEIVYGHFLGSCRSKKFSMMILPCIILSQLSSSSWPRWPEASIGGLLTSSVETPRPWAWPWPPSSAATTGPSPRCRPSSCPAWCSHARRTSTVMWCLSCQAQAFIICLQELASEIWINYVAPKLPPDDPLRVIQNNFKNALNIIRTFGRFPHRNELLGRENTDNEVLKSNPLLFKYMKSALWAPCPSIHSHSLLYITVVICSKLFYSNRSSRRLSIYDYFYSVFG